MEWKEVAHRGIRFVVSSSGHVMKDGCFLRQWGYPYKRVTVWYTPHVVHQIIAMAFCKGYKPGLVVNHKNTNKRDNRAENLEWGTNKYNLEHARLKGCHLKPKIDWGLIAARARYARFKKTKKI